MPHDSSGTLQFSDAKDHNEIRTGNRVTEIAELLVRISKK